MLCIYVALIFTQAPTPYRWVVYVNFYLSYLCIVLSTYVQLQQEEQTNLAERGGLRIHFPSRFSRFSFCSAIAVYVDISILGPVIWQWKYLFIAARGEDGILLWRIGPDNLPSSLKYSFPSSYCYLKILQIQANRNCPYCGRLWVGWHVMQMFPARLHL